MEYILVVIPIVLTIIFSFIVRRLNLVKKLNNEGLLLPSLIIPTASTLLLILIMSQIMRYENFKDTEYLSYYYTKIRHTDRWNEYIHRTCTRRVPAGRDSKGNTIYRTQTYDCSYVENHPERWLKYDNSGEEEYISEEEFMRIKSLWKTPMVFVDMHRHYYTIDGDAQEYYWNNNWRDCLTYTVEHNYENRILGSESVLKYQKITPEEAKELGLFEYPSVDRNYDQNPIIGYSATKDEIKRFQFLNSYYGKNKQIRVFVLVYPSQSGVQITEDQKAYWQGGNKNELIICIGIDGGKKIKWANCFSWQSNPELDIRCRNFLLEQKQLNLMSLSNWIIKHINLWERRQFSEFKYIQSFLTGDQVIGITWTVIGLNILLIVIFIVISFKTGIINKYKQNN